MIVECKKCHKEIYESDVDIGKCPKCGSKEFNYI